VEPINILISQQEIHSLFDATPTLFQIIIYKMHSTNTI